MTRSGRRGFVPFCTSGCSTHRFIIHSEDELDHLTDPNTLFGLLTVDTFANLYAHQDGHRTDFAVVNCAYDFDGSLVNIGEEGNNLHEAAELIISPVLKSHYFSVICLLPLHKRAIVYSQDVKPVSHWNDHLAHLLRRCFGAQEVGDWGFTKKTYPHNSPDCGPFCCLITRQLLEGTNPDTITYLPLDPARSRQEVVDQLRDLYDKFGYTPRE